jgi:hypothetical protein
VKPTEFQLQKRHGECEALQDEEKDFLILSEDESEEQEIFNRATAFLKAYTADKDKPFDYQKVNMKRATIQLKQYLINLKHKVINRWYTETATVGRQESNCCCISRQQ